MHPTTLILRAEGGLFFGAAVWAYSLTGGGWGFFALLLLAPDIFMVGYLKDPRIGAHLYNLGHTYLTPLLLSAVGFATQTPVLASIALVWIAHIGMDRALGFGLKNEVGFKDTHLGKIN